MNSCRIVTQFWESYCFKRLCLHRSGKTKLAKINTTSIFWVISRQTLLGYNSLLLPRPDSSIRVQRAPSAWPDLHRSSEIVRDRQRSSRDAARRSSRDWFCDGKMHGTACNYCTSSPKRCPSSKRFATLAVEVMPTWQCYLGHRNFKTLRRARSWMYRGRLCT